MGRANGSMCSTTWPFWKSRTVPDDWLTAMAMALVLRLMAAAAQWRVPRPLRQGDAVGGGIDVHAGGHRHAVAADDDGAFELGDVLDLLADLAVADVALLGGCSRGKD